MEINASQPLPAPKGKTLREKVNQEAETFEQQNLEITHQRISPLGNWFFSIIGGVCEGNCHCEESRSGGTTRRSVEIASLRSQ
jgi:hypothetical protein